MARRDLYCWVCHLETPLLKCVQCPRAYHRGCMAQMGEIYPPPKIDARCPNPSLLQQCPECLVAEETAMPNMKSVTCEDLRNICIAIAKNLKNGYFWPNPFYKLDYEAKGKDIVAKIVDICELENLAYLGKFNSLEGFMGEAKWILHNTIVIQGRCSKDAELAKDIVDLADLEVMSAHLCPGCYLREQDRDQDSCWFIKACGGRPHPLGWVKLPEGEDGEVCIWPVKLMDWNNEEGLITVRTFGDYRRFDVPPTNCYLYSRNVPKHEQVLSDKRGRELQLAIKEIELHIPELEKVVGVVKIREKELSLYSLRGMEDIRQIMFPNTGKISEINNN